MPAVRSAPAPNFTANQFNLSAGASWTPDIWGAIRRSDHQPRRKRAGKRRRPRRRATIRADHARHRLFRVARDRRAKAAARRRRCRLYRVPEDHAEPIRGRQRRAVGGAASQDPGRADQGAGHQYRRGAHPARTCHRGIGRQATRRFRDQGRGHAGPRAGDAARPAVDAVGAPARHRRRRTHDGRAERANRYRDCRLLSRHHAHRLARRRQHDAQ